MASSSPPDPRSAKPRAVGYLLLTRQAAMLPAPESWPALLDALGAHSPAIEPDPPAGCWLDLRPGKRGSAPATLGAALLATADDWGYADARLGVTPTPGVARLAAWHGATNPTILPPLNVAAFLAPLPVGATGLPAEAADRLALVGLRTLGDLAALPRGALGDYLGPAGPALEALARGEDDRPLVPTRAPLVLTARRELDWSLNDRAQLTTLLARLLAPLLARLRQQGLGATRVTLTLTGERGQSEATARASEPTTDAALLLHLLLVALPADATSDDGSGGITAVAMTIIAPRPLAGRQASFFDVPQGRRGLLALGVDELRRRARGEIGHLCPADLAHSLPDYRYRFVAVADNATRPDPEGA
jgi:hypothetical protein